MQTDSDLKRFWSKVDKSAGEEACWLWTGGKAHGYGIFCFGAKKGLAHRYIMNVTESSSVVLHKCDNPACVNPAHLKIGTQAENMRDMAAKGRHQPGGQHGVQHHAAKFTAEDVAAIRASDAPHTELARKYGVSAQAVMYVRRKGWKSVDAVAVHHRTGSKAKVGEANHKARFTSEDIRRIRGGQEPASVLAAEFKTQASYINKIRKRKAWKHVD